MILKKIFGVIFCVGVLNQVSAVSYSKVYVQSGADVPPLQYYNYGVPGVSYAGSQVSRLTAPPVGSTLPLAQPANFLPPCVLPCIPTQPVATMANANLLAYNSPSAPIITVPNDDQSSYGYAYAVYNNNNGPAVRGQYYLQPGYDGLPGRLVVGSINQSKETKPCNDEKLAAIKEPTRDDQGNADLAIDQASPAAKGEAPPGDKLKEDSNKDKKQKDPSGRGPEAGSTATTAEVKKEKATPADKSDKPVAEKAEQAVVKLLPPGNENGTPEQARPIVVESPTPGVIIANPPISYDTYSQLMRCIQATKNAERVNSPLSYVLLPTYPC